MLLFSFSPSLSWSSEDACHQFCPEHFISKLSYVQLDQKHCLFILPSANKFVFRALLTQLLFSAFLSNNFAFVLAKHGFSPSPTHSRRGTCGALQNMLDVHVAHHGQHRAYGHQSFNCSLNTVLTGIRCINGSGY